MSGARKTWRSVSWLDAMDRIWNERAGLSEVAYDDEVRVRVRLFIGASLVVAVIAATVSILCS